MNRLGYPALNFTTSNYIFKSRYMVIVGTGSGKLPSFSSRDQNFAFDIINAIIFDPAFFFQHIIVPEHRVFENYNLNGIYAIDNTTDGDFL